MSEAPFDVAAEVRRRTATCAKESASSPRRLPDTEGRSPTRRELLAPGARVCDPQQSPTHQQSHGWIGTLKEHRGLLRLTEPRSATPGRRPALHTP